MKTSKKYLITIAGIIIALLVTTLFVLRKDMKSLLANQSVIVYKAVSVDRFDGLDFSANWIVNIKQGKNCKVELAVEEGDSLKPKLENIDGTLYLINTRSIHARITAPSLQVIRAAGDTKIKMKNFWSDSLIVILEDSCSFSGSRNDFSYISFKVSGNDR